MISKQDLLLLNYKQLTDKLYAKPIGFHLFVINIKSQEIFNYFKSASKNEIRCYESRFVDSLISIKEFECYSRTDISNYSKFEFLTNEEHVKCMLDDE